jgi:hypothetical protein
MKKTAFCDMLLCSLVRVDLCFRGSYRPLHQGDHPDDGSSTLLRDYATLYPRILSSLCKIIWKIHLKTQHNSVHNYLCSEEYILSR